MRRDPPMPSTSADGSAAFIVAVWPGAAWITSRSRSIMNTFSVQGPVTVIMLGSLGEFTGREFNAAVMLEKAPGVAPVQSTVTLAARAAVGKRKDATASSRPVRGDKHTHPLRIPLVRIVSYSFR